MREFFNILKDIRSGALPIHELPGFVAWLVQQSRCFWMMLIVIVTAILAWYFK